ncbi:hypothetical protein B0H21DRAFT_708895 [Amylocystis lapponica]|nr:hypothetical protein B0H21DRAFT_708895 [Amylocystis lapponica]
MRLMRKVRKMSRAFGDVPVPLAVDEPSRDTAKNTVSLDAIQEDTRYSLAESPRHSLSSKPDPPKRSLTLGHSSGRLSVPASTAVHRARSLASLQPAVAAAPIPVVPSRSSPVSPIIFAWPDGLPPSQASSALNSPLPSPAPSIFQSESDLPMQGTPPSSASAGGEGKQYDSAASFVLVPEDLPQRPPRTRAGKLTRQLGKAAPSDALLRASSPVSRGTSPIQSVLRPSSPASHSHRSSTSPVPSGKLLRRTESVRPSMHGEKKQRRLSLDLRAFAGIVPSPASTSSAAEPTRMGRPAAKTRSVWMPKRVLYEEEQDAASSSLSLDIVDEDEISRVRVAMSEKQHAMAVRRARKIEQLLGDKPPSALFRPTGMNPGAVPEEDAASTSSSDHYAKRDTLKSVASSISSALADNGSIPESSSAAAPEPLSPIWLADQESPLQALASPDSQSETSPEPDYELISPLPAHPDHPGSDNSGMQYRSLPSTTSLAQSIHSYTPLNPRFQPELMPLPPRTPPPFSNMFIWPPEPEPEPVEPPRSPSPPSGPEFHARQQRAAKLSRFFGVAPGDLAEALPPLRGTMTAPPTPTAPSRPRTPRPSHRRPSTEQSPPPPQPLLPVPPLPFSPSSAPAEVHHAREPSTTVEVAAEVAARSPFRFFDSRVNNVVKDMDMRDVIEQLRKMR